MALKIRMRLQGRNNRPFYRIVLTDARAPRDGKYLENLGWYDPQASTPDQNLSLKTERIQHWLGMGAILTEKVASLVARSAPEVTKEKQRQESEKRAKLTQKRRESRKEKAEK